MGEPVLIYGKSGSGKSRSLKNFAEDEIYYVNVGDKSLPFRKKFKYTTVSDNTALIRAGLQKMPTKTAVIDDAGFILANQFMDEHSKDKRGGDVYKMYDSIADNFWGLLKFIKTDLPKDVKSNRGSGWSTTDPRLIGFGDPSHTNVATNVNK